MGKAAVADWWLRNVVPDLGVTAAAAPPATTKITARMRTASFIIGNLFFRIPIPENHLYIFRIIVGIKL